MLPGSREVIYGNWAPFGGSVFDQVREVQREPPPPPFTVFQMVSVPNNQYANVAYFGAHVLPHLITNLNHVHVSDNNELSMRYVLEPTGDSLHPI